MTVWCSYPLLAGQTQQINSAIACLASPRHTRAWVATGAGGAGAQQGRSSERGLEPAEHADEERVGRAARKCTSESHQPPRRPRSPDRPRHRGEANLHIQGSLPRPPSAVLGATGDLV